jgi:hypothetical protein
LIRIRAAWHVSGRDDGSIRRRSIAAGDIQAVTLQANLANQQFLLGEVANVCSVPSALTAHCRQVFFMFHDL